MALSQFDNDALAASGNNFVTFFATLALQTFFYGIYAVLFFSAMIIQCQKPMISRAAKIMLIIIMVMFISTSFYYAASVAAMVAQLKVILIDQDFDDVPSRLDVGIRAALQRFPYGVIENWMSAINFCASDAVVVWRAWALTAGNRKIVIPSVFLLGLAFISSGVFAISNGVTNNLSAYLVPQLTVGTIGELGMRTLSLLTNISATVVISWKAWEHRQLTRVSSKYQTQSQLYRANSILSLLVESGIVYMFFQVVLVILSYLFYFGKHLPNSGTVNTVLRCYLGTFIVVSGIYPTLVVFFVAVQQRSLADAKPASVLVQIPEKENQELFDHTEDAQMGTMESKVSWGRFTPETRNAGDVEAAGGIVRSDTNSTASAFSVTNQHIRPTISASSTSGHQQTDGLHEQSSSLPSSINRFGPRGPVGPIRQKPTSF